MPTLRVPICFCDRSGVTIHEGAKVVQVVVEAETGGCVYLWGGENAVELGNKGKLLSPAPLSGVTDCLRHPRPEAVPLGHFLVRRGRTVSRIDPTTSGQVCLTDSGWLTHTATQSKVVRAHSRDTYIDGAWCYDVHRSSLDISKRRENTDHSRRQCHPVAVSDKLPSGTCRVREHQRRLTTTLS